MGSDGSFTFYNPNLVMHRRRAGLVRSQRDFVSPNGWKPDAHDANRPVRYGQAARRAIADGRVALVGGLCAHERCGADTRVRSPAPFVTSGVAGAFLGDGLKAVVPGVRDGWDPFGDVFLQR